MEHLRCSTISMRAAAETHHLLQPARPATHSGYAVQQQRRTNRSSATALAVAIASELPSDAVVATAAEPTTDRRSLPRSKPFITTATTSTFQICRGRKPTLITEATRGKSSSPVINKFNSIPLRSWPISDLNRAIFQSIFLWPIPLISIQEWIKGKGAQDVHYTACTAHLLPDEHHTSARRRHAHVHEPARCHGYRLARANCRRRCPRAATASARCPLPASTAFIHVVRAVHQQPRLLGPSRQQSTARLP
ncbi:hypothetical protein ACLOJK_014957, partial [Asimina triloba]